MSQITYKQIHLILREECGKASEYQCSVDGCFHIAEHWAYQHTAEAEYANEDGSWPYSVSMDDYAPMCSPCHAKLDKGRQAKDREIAHQTSPETRQKIAEWLARGMSMTKIATALNAEDISTPRGVQWTRFNVFRVVRLMREEDAWVAAQPEYRPCRPLMEACKQSGLTPMKTAMVLNESGYRTILGDRWTESAVASVFRSLPVDERIRRVYAEWLAEFGEDAVLPSAELNSRIERARGGYSEDPATT